MMPAAKTLALAVTLVTLVTPGVHAADWTDTTVGLRGSSRFVEPGIQPKVAKTIMNFTHVSGDKLGTNLFVIDLLASDSQDPAHGGGGGAQEWYGFLQRSFSLNALAGRKGFGFAKDLSLVARFDAGAKNTTFAPRPRKLRLGIGAALPVSAGFWDVGVQAYKETNHNGIVGTDVTFDVAPVLTTAWAIPAGPGTFAGFADVIGEKGRDGFGAQTKTEVLARATYLIKLGGGFEAGVGVEYWKNKFGNDASVVPGSRVTTPLLLAQFRL